MLGWKISKITIVSSSRTLEILYAWEFRYIYIYIYNRYIQSNFLIFEIFLKQIEPIPTYERGRGGPMLPTRRFYSLVHVSASCDSCSQFDQFFFIFCQQIPFNWKLYKNYKIKNTNFKTAHTVSNITINMCRSKEFSLCHKLWFLISIYLQSKT